MKIPLARPDITNKDRKAVLEVLKTPYLSLGPKLKEFEEKFAEFAGVKYAIGVSNGTSALHLIIRALGIKEGDEVITSPFSFIASANCILYERAKPVFADIDRQTLNVDPREVEKKITKKTKAILAVDIFGQPADWNELKGIAKKYHLFLVEDSAEALGSEYKGRKCGSIGDASIFSFYPNKQIVAGEGAVILTDNKKIADLCRSMANQGRKIKNEKWLEHIRLGYNYRMTEMQAVLGITQLSRIEEILKKRGKVAKMYNERLGEFSEVEIPYVSADVKRSWFVYAILIRSSYSKKDRARIVKLLSKKGIQTSNYFQPIHLQPFYRKMFGYKRGDFPICEDVSKRTIALPFYNTISKKEIEYVVDTLKMVLKKWQLF